VKGSLKWQCITNCHLLWLIINLQRMQKLRLQVSHRYLFIFCIIWVSVSRSCTVVSHLDLVPSERSCALVETPTRRLISDIRTLRMVRQTIRLTLRWHLNTQNLPNHSLSVSHSRLATQKITGRLAIAEKPSDAQYYTEM